MSTRWLPTMPNPYSMRNYLVVLFLGYLSLGIAIPAMSLIIVSKGFSLALLGTAVLCFSTSVMVFEVPSGIFCDARGRRLGFQMGLLFNLVGSLLLFTQSLALILLGFACNGVGRAFTSGSLDALFIENHLKAGRPLEEVMLAMEVVSAVALALGSIVGGFLLTLGKSGPHLADTLLFCRILLLFLCMVLVSVLIPKDQFQRKEEHPSFLNKAKLLFQSLQGNRFVQVYMLFSLLQGFQLASLESYWQPYLKLLLSSDGKLWVLGLVGGSVFAISIVGSLLGKVLMQKVRPSAIFLTVITFSLLLELVLAITRTPILFVAVYLAIYLALGCVSVVGGYLLNLSLEAQVRSSVLSLSSFALQGGGLFSSLLAIVVLTHVSIPMFWLVVSLLGLTLLVVLKRRFLQAAPGACLQ